MADDKRAGVVAKHSEDFDRPTLIRVGAWGICAVLAMVVVVVAARSELGTKRAAAAVATITSPPRDATMTIAQVLARTAESDREARRLAETVRSLSAERDRIAMRIDGVEREMGDLTGSIGKTLLSAKQDKLPIPAAGSAPAVTSGPAEPVATSTSANPALPATSLPTLATPAARETPKQPVAIPGLPIPGSPSMHIAPPAPLDPKAARLGWPLTAPTEVHATTQPAPASTAVPTSMSPTSPSAAEPDHTTVLVPTLPLIATENIPLPRPSPLAALTSGEAAHAPETTASTDAAPRGSESKAEPQPTVAIGIDLGPALSMSRLRLRWEAFRKAQGPASDGMRPLIAIREMAQNKPVEMRLVAGPLADVGAAAQMCASLAGSQFPCQPAVFDGQRLALQ